jgi:two-component system, OmpR family, manganese sensing sensor histidine kinase
MSKPPRLFAAASPRDELGVNRYIAPTTGSPVPTSRTAELVPRALEHRLLLAYLAAFATTFLIAGLAVRVAFTTSLERQTTTRLEILARAGLRSTLFAGGRLRIDEREISNTALLARGQGLQWFDRRGHRLAAEGLVPDAVTIVRMTGRERLSAGRQTLETLAMPIVNPATGEIAGAVRASESDEDTRGDVRRLDIGLLIGTVLGLAGSGLGGRALSRQAVQPIGASVRTLREFTADASHELRGPLAAFASNADAALRDEDGIRPRDRSRFTAIADASKQMSRLTEDLLLLACAERSLKRDLFIVDLGDVVTRLVGLYQPQFDEKRVALVARLHPELAGSAAHVFGNPDQIERILANIIENALRYTPAGGTVSIDARRSRTSVCVSVRDTGIGIAPEHLTRVFDRFWRAETSRSTSPTGGGTGLGLAIARALAQRHGGDVGVSSDPGRGSEFTVWFPTRPPAID